MRQSNNKPIISLTSDFGDSFAVSQLEIVIHSLNPEIKFVIASKDVTPFSIIEGAFIIKKFFPFSKPRSIHIGVVDPGVGSNRRAVIIQTKNHWFIGPNNGLLYPAATEDRIVSAFAINEDKIGHSFSNTFHGRDIFAKVAAIISNQANPETIADRIDISTLTTLTHQENQVLHIDAYGNIKVNNSCQNLSVGDLLTIQLPSQTLSIPFVKTFNNVDQGQFLAYLGSHQILEIAQNQGFANSHLQLKVGDIIQIQKYR